MIHERHVWAYKVQSIFIQRKHEHMNISFRFKSLAIQTIKTSFSYYFDTFPNRKNYSQLKTLISVNRIFCSVSLSNIYCFTSNVCIIMHTAYTIHKTQNSKLSTETSVYTHCICHTIQIYIYYVLLKKKLHSRSKSVLVFSGLKKICEQDVVLLMKRSPCTTQVA